MKPKVRKRPSRPQRATRQRQAEPRWIRRQQREERLQWTRWQRQEARRRWTRWQRAEPCRREAPEQFPPSCKQWLIKQLQRVKQELGLLERPRAVLVLVQAAQDPKRWILVSCTWN